MNSFYNYFIILILTLIIYYIFYYLNKNKLNKLANISNIIFILSFNFYLYILLSGFKFVYKINFITAIILFISLALIIYFNSLLINNYDKYKKNINIYILLYFILLISITMIINRVGFKIRLRNFQKIYFGLTPFKSITNYLKYKNTRKIIYNIFGNFVMLIPFSFLLMIKDKKYNNIFKQIIIIFPVIILIEILQVLTNTGSFDVDDIILNLSGVLIFIFLNLKINLIEKIRNLFYKKYFTNKLIYCLIIISYIYPVFFIIKTFIITIKLLYTL